MLVCSVRWDHIWIQSPMTNIRIALYRLIRRLTGRAAQASGVIQTGITHPQDLEDPFSDPSARERVAQVILPMLGTLDEVVLPKTKDYLRGSRTVNVVPRVSLESTLISPPCASTSNFAT